MANEFIARKGLIVLTNGATVTGSLKTQGNIIATGYEVSASRYSGSFYGDGSNLVGITATGLDIDNFGADLTGITVAGTDKLPISDAGTEGRINVSQLSTPLAGTGLEANAGTIRIAAAAAGAGLTGGAGTALSVNSGSMLPYYSSSIFSTVSGDITINSAGVATIAANSVILGTDTTGDYVATITAGSGISSSGATTGENISHTISINTASAHFVTGSRGTISSANTTGAGAINLTYNNATGVFSGSLATPSASINGTTVTLGAVSTITANTTNALTFGAGLSGGTFNGSTAVTTTIDTASAHFTGGVKTKLNTDGVISSSTQFNSLTTPFTGSFTGSFTGNGTGLTNVTAASVDYANVTNKPTLVSSSTQFNSLTAPFTGSFTGSHFGSLVGTSSFATTANTVLTNTVSYTAGAGLSGGGTATLGGSSVTIDVGAGLGITVNADDIAVNTASAHFVTGARATISSADTAGAGGINLRYNSATGVISGSLVNSSLTVTAGSGLSGGGAVSLGGTTTVTLDTASAHFTNGVKTKMNTDGVISGSSASSPSQGTVRVTINGVNTDVDTGLQTGDSPTFAGLTSTGIVRIGDTTNSTLFNDGALIISGGVGIAKDVNISGSLRVLGLLSAVSMSTLYVTSSAYTVGTSRVIVNDDDFVRFAGLSVIDSGSTYGTGSLLWDSLNNRWIYQADDLNYNSAIIIAGPKNFGTLGDEVGLTDFRVPVAHGDDHIDSRPQSSSIRVDFPSRLTHIEAGLVVTGSVTASVAFSGSFIGSFIGTGSWADSASRAISASYVVPSGLPTGTISSSAQFTSLTAPFTGSFTGSFAGAHTGTFPFSGLTGTPTLVSSSTQFNSLTAPFTGSFTGSFTGALTGTSSWANNAISSSYVLPTGLPTGTISSSTQFNSLTSPFTGSFTGSFRGDGSNLTGIATTLNVSGSAGGGASVALQTQTLLTSGSNGVVVTATGQSILISGSNATTTTKGVASFNSTNFTVTGGEVTSNNITINGTNVTLGGTRNITLSEITNAGASTGTQVTFNGGVVIQSSLYTTGSNPDVDTGTEIIATVATASYNAAFFDYYISSASNYRAGTVTSVWQPNSTNIEFTDVSTNDIGNTAGLVLSVDLLNDLARLKATVSTDNWVVKTLVRAL